jgi:chlorobactene glucosyltransferase
MKRDKLSGAPSWGTFAGLGVLTGMGVASGVLGMAALRRQERVPPVDACEERAPSADGNWPFVSVIVPARNEERNLPRLLPTLINQRYPNYEVIVVDDSSTDATPRVLSEWRARDGRLRLVHGEPLPEGWRGKPWAMSQGVKAARGEWLLFTDADTQHSPLSVSSSMAYALRNNVDLLSILPRSELGSPSERVIMPVAFIGISNLYPVYRVNDPRSKVALANGQYIFIRRATYNEVGGIERVRDKIVEDMEFARVVKGEGHRLYLADGRHLMSVRMYTNLSEIWEGWSKNVVLSFSGKPGLVALTVTGILSALFLPFVLARRTLTLWKQAESHGEPATRVATAWLGALTLWYVLFPFAYRRTVDRMMGLSPAWTLTQPLGILAMLGIMLHSLVRLLTGRGVTWKGRRYQG